MQYPSAKPALNCSLVQLGVRSFLMVLTLALIRPAWAQQPSPDQISAIRSSCRADYQAHCSNVQPGGPEALACLKKNVAALSPGCQNAVSSVGGAPAQRSSAAAADMAAPTPPAGSGAGMATGVAPNMAPNMAPSVGAMPSGQPPRAQLAMLRQVCAADYRVNCAGVPLGGGRAISCLAANQSRLSPGCQRALAMAKPGM